MDSKQFAWGYLIENGTGGVKKSYYGGFELADTRMQDVFKSCHRDYVFTPMNECCLSEILKYGINWDKTEAPKSSTVSEFTGTFSDPAMVETITGELVLNNGSKQHWVGESLKVTNIFDLMADAEETAYRYSAFFNEL